MEPISQSAFEEFPILHCPDRLVITGTSIDFGHEYAMRSFCYFNDIDQYYLAGWARPLTERIRELAREAAIMTDMEIIDCNKFKGRKDEFVKSILAKSQWEYDIPICVFKSMETCTTFYRSQSKMTVEHKGSPFRLRPGKCMHYYIYFMDEVLGLVGMRIQSYAPFAIQYIINGHEVLARLMDKQKISYIKEGNCFTYIDNHSEAQHLANTIVGPYIVERLTYLSRKHIPLDDIMPNWYRFTVRQAEMSTDIFIGNSNSSNDKMRATIRQLCIQDPNEMISYLTDAKATLKAPEMGCRETHLGVCVKFHQKTTSIKVYHKNASLIRIETSSYDLTDISYMRTIRGKDGELTVKRRPLARALADIQVFFEFATLANKRMRDRLNNIWSRSFPREQLKSLTNKVESPSGFYSGINLFNERDGSILSSVNSPSFDLAGFKRSDLISRISGMTKSQATYAIRRLKAHGVIKKENGSNRYFITKKGRLSCTAVKALDLLVLTPMLAA